jgi:hypothetical protein
MLGYQAFPAALRRYIIGVSLAGALVAGMLAVAGRPPEIPLLTGCMLLGLAVVAERFPLHLTHKTNINVATAAYVAMWLALPVGLPALLAGIALLVGQMWRHRSGQRVDFPELVFNAAQNALYVAAGSLVYESLRTSHLGIELGSFGSIGTVVLAALSMHLVNTGLVAGAVGRQMGTSSLRVWSQTLALDLVPHITLTVVGIAAALLAESQPLMLPALVVPVLLIQRAIGQTVRLRIDTHEALAALVEVVEWRRTGSRRS